MSDRNSISLGGARVALLEGRMAGELAGLVRRYGGEPYAAPALVEAPVPDARDVAAVIDTLAGGQAQIMVCLTGVGVQTLFDAAEQLGRLPELLAAMRTATIVCRGPKPSAVLRRHNIPIAVIAAAPYTAAELLSAMSGLELTGRGVLLLHYGERNTQLVEALQARGARVQEALLYEWRLPEDLGPLRQLVRDVAQGQVDAIAFTSQVQARHLFQVAAGLGMTAELAAALNGAIVVAAVGPVCRDALLTYGVRPDVVPENPKMVPMLTGLAEYFARRGQKPREDLERMGDRP